MRQKMIAMAVALCLALGFAAQANAAEKMILYTSMKESLIGAIYDAFKKKHPDTTIDYQSAGAGKLMAKIAAERQAGKVLADVLWTSEVPDFYNLKSEGMLETYVPTNFKELINPFDDHDGSFTAARLGTLGIVYNTKFIKQAPAKWDDIFGKDFNGAFGIANPALSGTAYMSISLLVKQFGWEFIEKMAANKSKIGKGAGQVVDDTASGELVGCIAVDYITLDKIKKGATLGYAFPPEILVVPSPVAIIKGTPNLSAAKKFVDFLLSKEAQEIIAAEGTLPVRNDVALNPGLPIASPAEAVKRSIKIDYLAMMAEKQATVKKFTDIMQGKK
ncbi:Extracellular solute-binding protein family 1 [uncultured delta proteobacterium]|uniref:Extracellular solute-binding protein family 1 n=1 Tax=uncultured delta proteobacterium TaxID=34034 RepID=A0A212JEK3_9DELT|nr:Extracellular solute-binding protein family 1 [uncultured delta proteobacterium]